LSFVGAEEKNLKLVFWEMGCFPPPRIGESGPPFDPIPEGFSFGWRRGKGGYGPFPPLFFLRKKSCLKGFVFVGEGFFFWGLSSLLKLPL